MIFLLAIICGLGFYSSYITYIYTAENKKIKKICDDFVSERQSVQEVVVNLENDNAELSIRLKIAKNKLLDVSKELEETKAALEESKKECAKITESAELAQSTLLNLMKTAKPKAKISVITKKKSEEKLDD